MKVHLPLLLLSCLMTALTGNAETVISETTTIVLDKNTTYENAQFSGPSSIGAEGFSLTFDGQGEYSLHFEISEAPDNNGNIFQLYNSDISGNPMSLTFTNLTELDFSAGDADFSSKWISPINMSNNHGDTSFFITNIAGDVSLQNFSGNKIATSSILVSSSGPNGAHIQISDIAGKFSIRNNKAENRADQFTTIGIYAKTSPGGNEIKHARIFLSGIAGGIELSNNTKLGAASFSGIITTFNAGLGDAAIDIRDISGGITITNNKTSDYGIIASLAGSKQWLPPNSVLVSGNASISIMNVQGDVLFMDNSTYGSGALTLLGTKCNLNISDIHGDVLFLNNESQAGAGAIYCAPDPKDELPQRSTVTLSADYGNITFKGNKITGTKNVANAMIIGGNSDVHLNAAEGRTIAFYDPVVIDDDKQASVVHFNQAEYSGEILFSGENYTHSEKSDNYTSKLEADVIQYNGTVHLAGNASMEAVSYVQQKGILILDSGTNLSTTGNVELENLVINMKPGEEVASIYSGGLFSLTGELSLSGTVETSTGSAHILSVKAKSLGVTSDATSFTQGGVIYSMKTEWNFNELDNLWEMLLTHEDIQAKGVIASLQGSSVINSMLSSASNMNALQETALDHLDMARFHADKKSSVWVSGLGGFTMQRTQGATEGFDYQGGGYALGGDTRISKEWILGAAYGQMFGKNISREFPSTNEQDSIMGLVDAAWHRDFNERHGMTVSGAIAYGYTDNEMKTFFSDGQSSKGDWNNRTLAGMLQAAWHITLPGQYILSPTLGLEYSAVRQNAFSETGDMARDFGKGNYRNLSLPVGISMQKMFILPNEMQWSSLVSISYIPDIYRHQPEGSATLSGYSWNVAGSHQARNAVRVNFSNRLILNTSWSAYCSYQMEARADTMQQTCSIGMGYSF